MGARSNAGWGVVAGWPDGAIGDLAGRQRTIVGHAQLRELGVSASSIRRALHRRRLHPVHRAVYSLVDAGARPLLAAETAAVLACGPTALLSNETAGRLHVLRVPTPAQLELVVVGADRRHPGLTVHRVRDLDPRDRARSAGLPVTSIARTIVDLAPSRSDRALGRLIDEALRKTSRAQIRGAAERRAGCPGARRVIRMLDPERPSSDVWSRAEARLLSLIGSSRLPTPEANVSIGPYVPDLMWRSERVIVEFDSWTIHGGRSAFDTDRDRHNQLTTDGWQVIHVTWEQLTRRPEQVLVWIAAALARSPHGSASRPA